MRCASAKPRMKRFASCCTRTLASKFRTKPSLVTAAKCWTRARQRSRVVQRRQQRNRPRLCPPNHQHNHILVTGGHVDRTSLIQKIFSAPAQVSPVAATKKRLQSNPSILKGKSLWGSTSATNSRCPSVQRALVADDIGENAAAPASVCHWQRRSGARLHSYRSADRLPLSATNTRPKRINPSLVGG